MNKPIVIHKLSEKMGLTSRTLRHWESEGLFKSTRDEDSGWRTYDDNEILCVEITALLRKLDISLKEIKTVIDDKTYEKLHEVINNKICALTSERAENLFKEHQLKQFLLFLQKQQSQPITNSNLPDISNFLMFDENINYERDDFLMSNLKENSSKLRFMTLPPMRVAYNIAVSISPEEEAMKPVVDWIKIANLTGTARLFGGNMEPIPSGEGKPYGYGMCASIPNDTVVPVH